jgi:hypothetical protein
VEGNFTDSTQVRGAMRHPLLFLKFFFDGFDDSNGPVLRRNVPGQALYLTSLQQVRNAIGRVFPSFAIAKDAASERLTTLARLTPVGNLVAGAVTRTTIGFVMNPLTIVKARYEVRPPLSPSHPTAVGKLVSFDLSPNGVVGRGGE